MDLSSWATQIAREDYMNSNSHLTEDNSGVERSNLRLEQRKDDD